MINYLGKDVISDDFTDTPFMKKEVSGTSFYTGTLYSYIYLTDKYYSYYYFSQYLIIYHI